MMAEVFTWRPDFGPQGETQFRTLEAQFGDGYRQSAGDGINNSAQSWPLTFRGQGVRIAAIKLFLDNHKGYLPFEWTPPMGSAGLYEAKSYTVVPVGVDYYTLTATFTQRFAP